MTRMCHRLPHYRYSPKLPVEFIYDTLGFGDADEFRAFLLDVCACARFSLVRAMNWLLSNGFV